MTERQRLARVFGIEPMRPLGAVVMAAAIAVIPMAWIASAAVAVGLCAIYAHEQRKIAEGLAEVTTWGFPVSGYRDWLLAVEPAFDLELRRDVGIDLLEASLVAVDRSIRVEQRGERVVRVLMRRIELRWDGVPPFLVGDRSRLTELRDRVLAPLHADVGIAAMRMGERAKLGALVAAPPAASVDGDAFREQAMVAPPDLQSLAHAGTSQLRPPAEARSLKLRTDRLLYATGQIPTDAKTMTYVVGGVMVGGFIVAPVGALIGAVTGSGIVYAMRRADRTKLEQALEEATRWPFPIEGFDNWLLSGRPICDIELKSAPPRAERAEIERSLRKVARVAELTWLTDTLVRMESQPIMHMAAQSIAPFWGGDRRELQAIVAHVLWPLHKGVGIVAVRMGGYLERRA